MEKGNSFDNVFQNSQDLFNQLLNASNMMIAVMDHNFNFVWVNENYAKVEAQPPQYFVGKNHFDLYPNKENLKIFEKVVNTGEIYEIIARPFEYENNPERGITYWNWTLKPLHNSGKLTHLVLSLLDVTEIRRLEANIIRRHEIELKVSSLAGSVYQRDISIQEVIDETITLLNDLLQSDHAFFSNCLVEIEHNETDSTSISINDQDKKEISLTNLLKGLAHESQDQSYIVIDKESKDLLHKWNLVSPSIDQLISDVTIFPIFVRSALYGCFIFENCSITTKWEATDYDLISLFSKIVSRGIENIEFLSIVKKSLDEKELLLKEVHHRVKNNLQVVSSMIYLERSREKNQQTKDALVNIEARINSIAMIYDQLLDNNNLSEIQIKENIEVLLNTMVNQFYTNGDLGHIVTKTSVANISIGIDRALSINLILSELIMNSIKHAFSTIDNPEISVELEELSDQIKLTIADNGCGFEKRIFEEGESIGLKIVNALITQLRGTLKLDTNQLGTIYTIIF